MRRLFTVASNRGALTSRAALGASSPVALCRGPWAGFQRNDVQPPTAPTAARRYCAATGGSVDSTSEIDEVLRSGQSLGRTSRSRVREATAVACQYKVNLTQLVALVESGNVPYSLALVYPRARPPASTASSGRVNVPVEVVVLRDTRQGEVAVFGDGTYVAFGMSSADLARFAHETRSCRSSDDVAWAGQSDIVYRRRFTTMADLSALGFEVPADATTSYIDEGTLDAIVLRDNSLESKLPFMYCLARRVQIDAVHTALRPVVEAVRGWRREMAKNGSLPVEVKDCRVRKARVMRLPQTKISARPRLFTDGDFTQLRHMYGMACYYFELHERSDILRARIENTAEGLKYLGSEASARTNHRLEWVIIALIASEIVIHLVPTH